MSDAYSWFDANRSYIDDTVSKITRKINKEYKKNKVVHEKLVKLYAYPTYFEIHTLEIPIFGSWEDQEETIEYSFDPREGDNPQALYEIMEALSNYYAAAGYDPELSWRDPETPLLQLYW